MKPSDRWGWRTKLNFGDAAAQRSKFYLGEHARNSDKVPRSYYIFNRRDMGHVLRDLPKKEAIAWLKLLRAGERDG